MAVQATERKLHWNYFIALERDLELASRYVEFCAQNLEVYSIEFAHLLFTAASEVDVIAKLLCHRLKPREPCGNINDYKRILLSVFQGLPTAEVTVPRYGLTFAPWSNWNGATSPLWWRSYNNVKHERDFHFNEVTLKNALNSLGALLILTNYHYSYTLAPAGIHRLLPSDIRNELQPEPILLHFEGDYTFNYAKQA